MTLTNKDKIEQFKRDCKSNEYYTKAIMECNGRIEELDVILSGLASHYSDDPKCENAGDPYASNKIGPMMEQQQVVDERNDYIRRINGVSTKLMMIPNPVDRKMITDLYISKRHYRRVVDDYNYHDYSALIKHIDAVIRKIV